MNLITVEGMAQELGSTREGVYARMRRGQLPAPMKIGDTPFWRIEDWKEWLQQQAKRQGVAVAPEPEQIAAPKIIPPPKRRGRPRKETVSTRQANRI